ncbi:MAG: hypothetical protein ACK5LJ_09740 [Paracoccus sp. (in: a-proteobacteria)]
MSLPSDRPIFLDQAAYRRRRLQDAARLLPLMTLCALLFPVWLVPQAMPGAGGVVILFAIWLLAIIASAVIHHRLRRRPSVEMSADEL